MSNRGSFCPIPRLKTGKRDGFFPSAIVLFSLFEERVLGTAELRGQKAANEHPTRGVFCLAIFLPSNAAYHLQVITESVFAAIYPIPPLTPSPPAGSSRPAASFRSWGRIHPAGHRNTLSSSFPWVFLSSRRWDIPGAGFHRSQRIR